MSGSEEHSTHSELVLSAWEAQTAMRVLGLPQRHVVVVVAGALLHHSQMVGSLRVIALASSKGALANGLNYASEQA